MSCGLGWWKLADGSYVNPDKATSVYAIAAGGGLYKLQVDLGSTGVDLNGTWPSEADAEEAARELVRGIDPALFD